MAQEPGHYVDEYRGWVSDRLFTAVEKKIIDHFIEKWSNQTCPVCSRTDAWNISGPAQMHSYAAGELSAGRHFPLIPVACTNCGYTLYFNGRLVGLTTEDLLDWERTSLTAPPSQDQSGFIQTD